MSDTNPLSQYLEIMQRHLKSDSLVYIQVTNRRVKEIEVNKVFIKPVVLKKGSQLSFIYKYATKDITKNYSYQESVSLIEEMLEKEFLQSEMKTEEYTYYLTLLSNGKSKLRHKINNEVVQRSVDHDHNKERLIPAKDNLYLQQLGITTHEFVVKQKMFDKFKQINKYAEIIDDILKKTTLPDDARIVDMGSGKGYLTFALYDYFTRIRKQNPVIQGVELRGELVETCNQVAKSVGFKNLHFEAKMIQDMEFERLDFLIALHACDTATDEAIQQGIRADAKLIICAPCCHRQVRKHMHTEGILERITRNGIMEERQAEILTDTIRAMILEAWGYTTRVFEFISTSHTPKNILIVASKVEDKSEADAKIMDQVKTLRETYGIQYHYLERIMS